MFGNPFLQNPAMTVMWAMSHRPINPYEGNGLLHPVYISPMMMHKLQQSVAKPTDPALDAAKAGNMYCDNGATVSCADTGKQVKVQSETGPQVVKAILPEKISCFGGCARYNPCNTNLYSSFVVSDHSCDDNSYWYTCESFEELRVFNNACMRHESGAKIDAPEVVAQGNDRYKTWKQKVMHNRRIGKGREIMYDDGDHGADAVGFAVGEGRGGDSPITDKQLGNRVDNEWNEDRGLGRDKYFDSPLLARTQRENMIYDAYDVDESSAEFERDYQQSRSHVLMGTAEHAQDSTQMMMIGLWSVLLSALFLCLCCLLMIICGWTVNKLRQETNASKKSNQLRTMNQVTYNHVTPHHDEDDDDDEEDDEEQDPYIV